MTTDPVSSVLARFDQALAARDANALAACFAADYRSEQPFHPARGFIGAERVRENWTEILADIPDFEAVTLGSVIDGDMAWTEIRWSGHKRAGALFDARGVIVMGIVGEKIAWARLYVEPVERNGEGGAATVERITHRAVGAS